MASSLSTLKDEFEAGRAQLNAAHQEIYQLTRANHELCRSKALAESKVRTCDGS